MHQRIVSPNPTPLNEIRKQIWQLRMEFWYRKIVYYPAVVHEAKNESMRLYDKIKSPKSWTPRDLVTFLVFAMQCWGAFVIGEIVTRRQFIGYPTADGGHH